VVELDIELDLALVGTAVVDTAVAVVVDRTDLDLDSDMFAALRQVVKKTIMF